MIFRARNGMHGGRSSAPASRGPEVRHRGALRPVSAGAGLRARHDGANVRGRIAQWIAVRGSHGHCRNRGVGAAVRIAAALAAAALSRDPSGAGG